MAEELRRRIPRKLCLQRNPKRRVRRLLENSDGPFKRRSARRTAVGCRVVVVFETSLGQRAFKGKRASERVGGQEEKERERVWQRELMSIENFHSLLCLSLSHLLPFLFKAFFLEYDLTRILRKFVLWRRRERSRSTQLRSEWGDNNSNNNFKYNNSSNNFNNSNSSNNYNYNNNNSFDRSKKFLQNSVLARLVVVGFPRNKNPEMISTELCSTEKVRKSVRTDRWFLSENKQTKSSKWVKNFYVSASNCWASYQWLKEWLKVMYLWK